MDSAHEIVIKPRRGWSFLDLASLWSYRELLYILAWRDIKIRYKQTALGAAWAVAQPLTAMVIFSVVFGRLAHSPSDGAPYPLFVYTGLLPWMFFSSTLSRAGNSVVANTALVTKVYFPRIIIPAGSALVSLLDLAVASTFLVGMLFWYGIAPSVVGLALAPVLVVLVFFAALGCGLWFAALSAEYRDFQYVIPFVIQIWMFATPVIYPATLFPQRFRWLLALNPMGGAVEGFRAAVLQHRPIPWGLLGISAMVTIAIFCSGLLYFQKAERAFADVI
jgi:lipopolysaccharide transport system permease protein